MILGFSAEEQYKMKTRQSIQNGGLAFTYELPAVLVRTGCH